MWEFLAKLKEIICLISLGLVTCKDATVSREEAQLRWGVGDKRMTVSYYEFVYKHTGPKFCYNKKSSHSMMMAQDDVCPAGYDEERIATATAYGYKKIIYEIECEWDYDKQGEITIKGKRCQTIVERKDK